MAVSPLTKVIEHLRGVLGRQESDGLSDGGLLGRFVEYADAAAFEALVRRHGGMVLGVCRRVLHDSHDAEDAFQATFLVLVRRASAVRPREMVGSWLYGVAYRTALAARRAAARRRARERRVREMARPEPADDVWREERPVLDRELARLPDKYRTPLTLCDLEGETRAEAARRLGWPEGTVASRLARARALLARRLSRHGVALAGTSLGVVLAQTAAPACAPAALTDAVLRNAAAFAAGTGTGMIPTRVAELTEGVVRAMMKTKLCALAVLVAALTLFGGAGFVAQGSVGTAGAVAAEEPVAADRVAVPEEKPAAQEAADDEKPSVKNLPPVVVQTLPRGGDDKVDAAKTREIRVTFSKAMTDKSWSWSQISDDTFPKVTGDIHYDKDMKTCVLPVKLEPGKTYVLWINSEKFTNFKDADGRAAVPYLLVFETKP
jgi:RNA polymerase sigma-70 factor (ECF subfamily)